MRMTYSQWMRKVDKYLIEKAGLTHELMEDSPYTTWYEDGVSPRSAALRALKSAGWND